MDKYGFSSNIGSSGVISEIQEEEEVDHNITNSNNHNISSAHAAGSSSTEEACVYVCVGKGDTSMEALSWALTNLVKQDHHSTTTTTLYLIHVFPQVKHIPNPLGAGMIARSKVSGELVERYMAQERANRRDLLHNFIQSCSSFKVKVETILIESDFIAKAILDLIPILHITNLVIGATKNHHRLRKSSSRKWNGSIADQIEQNAPESCKLRIICEGKEQQQVVLNQMPTNSPHPPPPTPHDHDHDHDHTASISNNKQQQQHHRHNGNGDGADHHDFPSCICFKPKFR